MKRSKFSDCQIVDAVPPDLAKREDDHKILIFVKFEILMNVLIYGDSYLGWTGGANLLGYLVRALLKGSEVTGDKVFFGVSSKYLVDPSICKGSYIRIPREGIVPAGTFETFLFECEFLNEIYFIDDLSKMIESERISIVGPSGISLGSLPCPWLGYLPDFQHQYLPEFFSYEERANRDLNFRKIVEQSNGIYVNSSTVVSDIQKFYPGFFPPKKAMRFPSLSTNSKIVISNSESTINKFGLSGKFFISCSQRWMHKQHELIIKAFRIFCENHPEFNHDLIFTGSLADYRSKDYGAFVSQQIAESGVSERIKSLGLIDRQDQLNLINNSDGLIQASLFEGGPGASGMLEAAYLSKIVIASNIHPNLEFNYGKVIYFKAQDPEDLYSCMVKAAAASNSLESCPASSVFNREKTQDVCDAAAGINLLREFQHILLSCY